MRANYSDEALEAALRPRLRTLDEIRDHRVKVETRAGEVVVQETVDGVMVTIAVDSAPSTKLPSRNLYTEEEVAELQASEAENYTRAQAALAQRADRIAELERLLSREVDRGIALEKKVRTYRDEVVRLKEGREADQREIEAVRSQIGSQVARAEVNRSWAERAEMTFAKSQIDLAEARKELRSKESMIEILEGHLKSTAHTVTVQDVERALDGTGSIASVRAEILADAVRQVQRISRPWSTSDPGTEQTSQA